MVHENSNDSHERRKLFDDGGCFSCVDVTRAARIEIQANGVCAQQHGVACVFEFFDAADFDARHNKPRIAVAGSDDVRKCSPIRNASAPAERSRSTSALPWMPLSTTKRRSSGISFASRVEVCTSTLNVFRSRLFTPMMEAPASSASPSSVSS